MKIKHILLVLIIGCITCCTSNNSMSDAKGRKIKYEVKKTLVSFFKSCNQANYEAVTSLFLNSQGFVYVFNGMSFSYNEAVDIIKQRYNSLINQEFKVTEEKYCILDKSSVIYTAKGKKKENYKDGSIILSEPMVIQITFRKIFTKWKIINMVESSVYQIINNK